MGNSADNSHNQPVSSLKRRDLFAGAAGVAALGLIGSWPEMALAATNCITGNSGQLGPNGTWRVFQNAFPPANNTAATADAYAYWPATDAFSWNPGPNNVLNTSTWTGGNTWYYVWANRWYNSANPLASLKPNPIQSQNILLGGVECRTVYTTLDKANAATRALVRYWLGMSNYADPWLAAGGTSADFVTYSALAASPATYFTSSHQGYPTMIDKVWLPTTPTGGLGSLTRATMASGNQALVPGLVLDYEVGDRRTAAQSTAFLQALSADLKSLGAKLMLYTNPLNRTANTHGLDATNLPTILQNYVDYLSVMLYGANPDGNIAQSYALQMSVLKGTTPACSATIDYSKLAVLFSLGDTTLADAQFVNNLLKGSPASTPKTLVFWRNGVLQGGACGSVANNQILGCVQGTEQFNGGLPVAPTQVPTGWTVPAGACTYP